MFFPPGMTMFTAFPLLPNRSSSVNLTYLVCSKTSLIATVRNLGSVATLLAFSTTCDASVHSSSCVPTVRYGSPHMMENLISSGSYRFPSLISKRENRPVHLYVAPKYLSSSVTSDVRLSES